MSHPPAHPTAAAHRPNEMLRGARVADPFRWLEDQESPATRAFLVTEDAQYRVYLDRHQQIRARIRSRVVDLLAVETVDLPVSDCLGGLLYLKRRGHEQQKAIYRQDRNGNEQRILSPEDLGRDDYASLAVLDVSSNGRYLVFGVRTGGADVQEICCYDLSARTLLPDRLARGLFRGLAFDPDLRSFYYVQEDEEGDLRNTLCARRHVLGTSQKEDTVIYEAGDAATSRLVLRAADDGSGIGYTLQSFNRTDVASLLFHPFPISGAPQNILLASVAFAPRFRAGAVEALTFCDAPDGRIVRIDYENSAPEAWQTLIAADGGPLAAWDLWTDRRVVHFAASGHRVTRVYSACGEQGLEIEFPPNGTTVMGPLDAVCGRLYYAHSDVGAPPSIYWVDLATGAHQIWWPSHLSSIASAITVERHAVESKDGVRVPVTLAFAGKLDRKRPVLLSAYGAGGASLTPRFSVLETVLLESGFLCVVAHVRGGGEGGTGWHEAGRREHKQRSVDDFLSVAEWLIGQGYCSAGCLGLAGQSAGGLLVLCALTQRPELFRAAVALGPLADLTRFHLFGVARGFTAELGSPDDPAEFAALYRLSPYHQVQPNTAYPATLVISGDCDKRCDALHARKMTARLKATALPGHPILLDYSPMRGHKPALPLRERIEALTNRLTFLIAELGSNDFEGTI